MLLIHNLTIIRADDKSFTEFCVLTAEQGHFLTRSESKILLFVIIFSYNFEKE